LSNPIIDVQNLTKNYRLGTIGIGSLIHDIRRFGQRIGFKQIDSKTDPKKFCALNRITFQAFPGEALGIIGHNGAGKSTLLKILSRITEPSSGSAVIRGKVASLLEVGTGFHPDMTGRENIFLNGAFLGLSKLEVKESFDSIVKFAHIQKFIDTPVKRYSSGMYVRLAFAIAAHLKPDVLIVDEVLAVGDLAFQKKCIEKMQYVAESGMTILFVSHNLEMIKKLCKRSILLEKGSITAIGETPDIITSYTKSKQQLSLDFNAYYRSERRRGVGFARFDKIVYGDNSGKIRKSFKPREVIVFHISIIAFDDLADLRLQLFVRTESQEYNIIALDEVISHSEIKEGRELTVKLSLTEHNLLTGSYPLYFWLGTKDDLHFDVLDDLLPSLQIFDHKKAALENSTLCSSNSSLEIVSTS